VHALACRVAGLYRGIWFFASLPDLKRVLRTVFMSTAGVGVFFMLFRYGEQVMPRSLLVLYPILLQGSPFCRLLRRACLLPPP
jgi:FlaA1/EpsC-like NDP-sugar epimerase